MKVTISKSKNSESFYIAKSFINNKGKSTSVNVRKLGTLKELLLEHGPTRDDIKKNSSPKLCRSLFIPIISWTLISRSFGVEVICSLKPFITVCSLIKPAARLEISTSSSLILMPSFQIWFMQGSWSLQANVLLIRSLLSFLNVQLTSYMMCTVLLMCLEMNAISFNPKFIKTVIS